MTQHHRWFLIPLICLLLPAVIQAQESRLALSDRAAFREAYLATPPSGTRSGRATELLVGLRVSSPSAPLDVRSLKVLLGKPSVAQPVCMRMIARDGRYSAAGTYNAKAMEGAPTLEIPTRYEKELKGYQTSDIAVATFVAPNCEIGRATELFIASSDGGSAGDMVVAQINAPQSRVRAQLAKGDTLLGTPILCLPIEGGPRVGFTGECRIPLLDASSGSYKLVLTETTGSGSGQNRVLPIRLFRDGSTK